MAKAPEQSFDPEKLAQPDPETKARRRQQRQQPAGFPELDLPAPLAASDGWEQSLGANDPEADFAIRETARAQRAASQAWQAFGELRQRRNPQDTPAQHVANLEKHQKTLQDKVLKHTDSARGHIARREADIEKAIEERLFAHSEHAAELRQVIRELPEAERHGAIRDAIEAGDKATLTAALKAHPLTVGLPAESLSKLRDYAERKLAADLHEKRQQLGKASALLVGVVDSTLELADTALGSRQAREKYIQETKAADEAQAAFGAALKGE